MEPQHGAPVAGGARGGELRRELAGSDSVGQIDVKVESAERAGFRRVGDGERSGRCKEKGDVAVFGRIRIALHNRFDFAGCAKERREWEVGRQGGRDIRRGSEDHITGLNVGADVGTSGVLAEANQFLHGELAVAADVDSPQQGEVG